MKKALTVLSAIVLAGAMVAPAMAQNAGITPTEVTNFNRYLDKHPEVAQKLAANPQLVNNPEFMSNHPGLEGFLSKHPGVREELHESPGQFMYREGHYNWSHGTPVSRFDNGYLDQHPEVAEQLARDPHLVDNPQYLATHPGLDQYFASHPEVRTELQQHPDRFTSREDRYEHYENGGGYYGGPHGIPVSRFDNGYLDEHPEVAQQLAKDPHLVDNPQYLATHPGLDQYFASHPEVRTELQQHPDRFMSRKARYEHYEDSGAHPMRNADRYLDNHPEVAQRLQKNPGLVDDPKYMNNHPGLHDFMQDHPVAREEWKSHPYRFMNHEQQYNQKH
jgi:hypothetical protein